MGCILHFTYLCLYIYTLLLIYKPSGSLAAKVSISQNITGLVGNNDTQLTCSFINNASAKIIGVELFAKNKTDEFGDGNKIAILKPNEPARLLSPGNYLNGRVTMTNITKESTNATLTFHVLKCEDEKVYMCKCYYEGLEGFLPQEISRPTRISVQTTSSRPDFISYIIVSLTETQENSSPMYTSLSTKQNDIILSFRTSTIDSTTTHLQSTENLPYAYNQEDNVMFTCTGDIGNPPGKLIWQKTFPQGKEAITYLNETTDIEEIPGNCSFKGTSHLTVKIYAEDIRANIRCFEESQLNITGMYIETEPFDVLFQVNHVDINKQPNQKQYDTNLNNITLTCIFKGIGNPKPSYVWFKEGKNNSTLSNKSIYVITNVLQNNSGVYTCEVTNIIDDSNYRKSNSVEIDIVHIDELPSSPDSATWMIVKEIVIPAICVVLFIVTLVAIVKYCCNRPNGKNKEESCSRKYSLDGITLSSEYASVILPKNRTAVEKGDALVCYNGIDDSKSKTKEEDVTKKVDDTPNLHTTSFQSTVYADPSDALQPQNCTYNIPHCMTSFKNQENI